MTKAQVGGDEPSYPQIGTVFDEGRLRLMSVIGTGGYGVVYQATDTHSSAYRSYAVKCLIRSDAHRQSHVREIALHTLASAHPGIITLHRIVEEDVYLYFVMEYAPDQDLFVQILHKCRYLGNSFLIKSAFLQLLAALEHCHSLGIYHRDLKPENIVCFEDGRRLALTDFGLATTQGTSGEFRTGSVYHMSPECQTSDATCEGIYSPQSCDIWSLGIVLLNIVTGRNPWKSANKQDPTFRSYRRNPYCLLPKILPISPELNDVLIMMLSIEWRARPSIPEIRAAFDRVDDFYSTDVIFEGNVARCSWETGMDLGTGVHKPLPDIRVELPPPSQPVLDDVPSPYSPYLDNYFFDDPPEDTAPSDQQDDGVDHGSHNSSSLPVSMSNSSLCTSDPSSPITPGNADSSIDRHMASRPSSFTADDKDRSTPDPEMFSIDL
ncbi:Negative regulator of sexual conjugation and meiosis [Leucoagaricus sp. SymC.cos]|nr:Negative regulator of sexual conjugation and meiosis [Leucoagaricus sp. SymC.cos]